LTRLDRTLVNGATAVVGVTGLAYAAFKHLMTHEDPFSAVNHPLQPWALHLHVLAAPVLVFAVGAIFKDHVIGKYLNGSPRPARRSGVLFLAVLLPSILTGYLLQVITAEGWRAAAAWTHLGFGVLLLLLYGAHLLVVPATTAASREGDAASPRTGATVTGLRIGPRRESGP